VDGNFFLVDQRFHCVLPRATIVPTTILLTFLGVARAVLSVRPITVERHDGP
jgi:hypothetical protein